MITRKLSTLFFLLLFSGFSIQAFAFNPKLRKGGIGEGIGTGGVENTNEVKLPIGLPFSINDAPGASGPTDGNDGYEKIVYTFDLPDGQGPQSYHETHSAFEQARSMNAACVLIRMNSMSNALDAAENLSNEITDYDRPVMVYVNDKAIPASTLISMAADNKKKAAIPKHKQAQAIVAKNKLTSDNQIKRAPRDERDCTTMSNVLPIGKQFTTGQNGDLDEVLTQAGLNNYTVVHYSHGFFAQMIDWCMKPLVSLLLIVLIALGLRLQIKSVFPGPATFLLMVTLPLFGVPLFVGGLAGAGEFGLAIFFVITTIIITRRKSTSPLLRFATIFFFILALTLCQSMSFGPLSDWKIPAITFLLSSATFLAGWYLPVVAGKFRRTPAAEFSPAA